MIFEQTIPFEPVSLKRHRHRMHGGTYDPSKKEKDDFIKTIENFPTEKMTKPIKCILHFYCKRPKTHYKTGKNAHILKDTAPKYNTNNKDLDNMVKFVLDALNDKLYLDDSLIFEITCSKLYSESGDGYIYAKFMEVDELIKLINSI
jgi:Holliday junction resolvase RusA-like endonuclease